MSCFFAGMCAKPGGLVVTFGDQDYGGDSSAVQQQLFSIQSIESNDGAYRSPGQQPFTISLLSHIDMSSLLCRFMLYTCVDICAVTLMHLSKSYVHEHVFTHLFFVSTVFLLFAILSYMPQGFYGQAIQLPHWSGGKHLRKGTTIVTSPWLTTRVDLKRTPCAQPSKQEHTNADVQSFCYAAAMILHRHVSVLIPINNASTCSHSYACGFTFSACYLFTV